MQKVLKRALTLTVSLQYQPAISEATKERAAYAIEASCGEDPHLRSGAWKWFSVEDYDGIRHGICLVETVEGIACEAKVKCGTSTTNLWRHLKIAHGFSKETPLVGCFYLTFG